MAKQKKPSLNKKSQRVVVDEIFDDGMARLLRAPRLPGIADKENYHIQNWDAEYEDFIESWRTEAFVGFPSDMKLKEGDIFYIVDGSKLNAKYKPIPRERARIEHLLLPWDISRQNARNEIKMQYGKLTATKLSTSTKDREILLDKVEKKFNMAS
ncbi:MAG: hypothetical protein GY850_16655 [bacterium]|nr:hypothetical protein [bacterium]